MNRFLDLRQRLFSWAQDCVPASAKPVAYWMYRKIYSIRSWHEIEEVLLHLLADPSRAAMDVGANRGHYTVALARICPTVLAFEPDVGHASRLKKISPSNVAVHNVALSNKRERVPFYIPIVDGERNVGLASLVRGDPEQKVDECEIETMLLDDFAGINIGFIKIDVEGHELEVLQGGNALIDRQRPVVLVEVENSHRDGAIAAVRAWLETPGVCGLLRL
jgi:FkbM family methyltransferase